MRLTFKGLTLRTPRTVASLSASARTLVAAIELPDGEVPWEGILTLEGIETGDERILEEGALTWADLPLPFTDEHDYERILGRLDTVTRAGNEIRGSGVFADTEEGRAGALEVALGLRRGLSVDLDAMEGEIHIEMPTDENGDPIDHDEPQDMIVIPFGHDMMHVDSARIRGVALCTIAAFAEAQIEVLAGQPANEPGEASVGDGEDVALVAAACSCGSQAHSIPVMPPRRFFAKPQLDGPTGIAVTSEGRVYGHLAGSGCHRSYPDRCLTVAGETAHTFGEFNNGPLTCEDGAELRVGQITLTGGHAETGLTVDEARRHYDSTEAVVADVVAGWDEANNLPWFSGALRPGVTPAQIRALRAQGVSGDWRGFGRQRSLIALTSVPVEGWPVESLAASAGEPVIRLAPIVAAAEPEVPVTRAEMESLRAEVANLRVLAEFRLPVGHPAHS